MTFKLRVLICGLPISQKKIKNTIKIKRSSVFFSWFISAISWSASLLFQRPNGGSNKSGNWHNYY